MAESSVQSRNRILRNTSSPGLSCRQARGVRYFSADATSLPHTLCHTHSATHSATVLRAEEGGRGEVSAARASSSSFSQVDPALFSPPLWRALPRGPPRGCAGARRATMGRRDPVFWWYLMRVQRGRGSACRVEEARRAVGRPGDVSCLKYPRLLSCSAVDVVFDFLTDIPRDTST